MVSIRYFSPAPALRRHISSYYWFESNLPAFSDLMRAELPQIRIITRGQARNYYAGGNVRDAGPIHIQGPTTGSSHYVADGPLHLFGVGILPEGWAALIGADAGGFADDAIDLDTVIGSSANDVLGAMVSARNDCERVAAADAFFLRLLDHAHATPLWFTRMTDNWLTSSANPDVEVLVEDSGMSARSVERLAKRIYGASPKLLSRKYRALTTAVRMGTGQIKGWSDLADCDFYDQPHFIKEFKQFVGMTPSRFMCEAAPLTQLTIQRRKLMPDLPKLALYS